jgi:DNA-binding CsgD family transcriptional regulator
VCSTRAARQGQARGFEIIRVVTTRERDALHLLALGQPNRAITERLVTSEVTIKSDVHHLIEKLGGTSRTRCSFAPASWVSSGQILFQALQAEALERLSTRGRPTWCDLI